VADCNGHMGCHSQPHSSNLIIKNIFWLAIKTRRWWRHAKLEDMGEMITSRTERTWRWRCHQVGERSRCSRLYDGRATCIANDTEPRRIIQLSTRGPGQSAALTLPPPSCMRGAAVGRAVDDEGAFSTNASYGKRCVDSHPTCGVDVFCPTSARRRWLRGSLAMQCPANRDLSTELSSHRRRVCSKVAAIVLLDVGHSTHAHHHAIYRLSSEFAALPTHLAW